MRCLVVLVALLGLSACAQHANIWKPHGPLPQIGEVIIDAPVDVVWQRLHEKISWGGFTVIGEDAEKREMTVLLKSWQPNTLIDCGRTDIYQKNLVQERHWVTPSANSLTYERYAVMIYYVFRQNTLLTESVVRLRERAGATAMMVDTTYTLTIQRSKQLLSPGGYPQIRRDRQSGADRPARRADNQSQLPDQRGKCVLRGIPLCFEGRNRKADHPIGQHPRAGELIGRMGPRFGRSAVPLQVMAAVLGL